MSVMPTFTVEHEANARRDPSPARGASSGTAPGFGGSHELERKSAHVKGPFFEARQESDAAPRKRRLVRVASELRTTITRIAQATGSSQRIVWFLGGAALGLCVVFAMLFMVSRTTSVPVRAPRLPTVPQVRMAPGSNAPLPAIPTATTTDVHVAPQAPAEIPKALAPEQAQREQNAVPSAQPAARQAGEPRVVPGKLPLPEDVSGTPLIGEPGF